MGIVSRIGEWLDHRFPEKMSADEVYKSLTAYARLEGQMTSFEMRLDQISQKLQSFENGARAFDKELKEVKDDMNKAKAILAVISRQRTAPMMPSGEPWKR